MKLEVAKKAINSAIAGRFIRVHYTSEVKPAAGYKGTTITKDVEITVRLGVQYSHIADVQKRREENPNPPQERKLWWKWISGYEHYLKESLTSDTKYLNVATSKISNSNVTYRINGKPATEDEVRAITPPSYWNKSGIDTFDIKLENVHRIGDVVDD